MSAFSNKNVLVTGGANGIGRLLGIKALEEGARCLVVWDIDTEAMKQLNHYCQQKGWNCQTHIVDMADPLAIESAAQQILQDLESVDILFNNAGIVVGKTFVEHSPDEIKNTLAINTEAVMLTTRAFLPAMIRQGGGHIVTISSASALMGNPGMSVYAASKWAVTGWADSLRIELEQQGSNIKVTTIQPSYIDTGMFAGVTAPLLTPLLEPEVIAEKIIRAVKKNKTMLREPFMVKLTPFLKGVLPARWFDFLAGKLFKVYASMNTFTGREQND